MSEKVPLIVIDVQNAFNDPSWGKRNNLDAEMNMKSLLQAWRQTNRPVIFIRHVSRYPHSLFYMESETSHFKHEVQPLPNEMILQKNVNSAFIGTNLEEIIRELNCPHVVIFGLTTNHCVETTTRMAGNLGFNPILVSDASATFDRIGPTGKHYHAELIHEMTLVNLHEEFATIMTTEELLKEVLYV
ncbi:cysteine hydrolase [Bacillus sp. RD4P76]|uniref:Cysteine hydrolase n=1 Tax=Bacillus suaedaesalsae TaxID=2810349 RepID=A0ABS2DK78_9BACI|nr:cysteine hydrolase family protein [Bacillus suaedaesalsae]MBM6618905.1 cysteine hydrolase [Bacillus suaedaesalsae]